jgi:signal transduction histidine kinase/DNA-binding response OmpR family regulator
MSLDRPESAAENEVVLRTLFPGDDETAVLARQKRWADTPLGEPAGWSLELRAALQTLMPSRVPMLVWWGRDLVQIYNEAYRPLLGSKHPQALGQPAADCWAEVWAELAPMTSRVLEGGEATFDRDRLLFLERHGYLEETYWTFSYSPIRSSAGLVLGVFVATTDVTIPRVEARRLDTVRDLAVLSSADFAGPTEAAEEVAAILARNRHAVPFAAIYLADPSGDLVAGALYGLQAASEQLPERVPFGSTHPIAEVGRSLRPSLHTYGASELGAEPGPLGPKPPTSAYLMPLNSRSRPLNGALVLGLNPYRRMDQRYRTFATLVARQLSALLADCRAAAVERARSAALADLDRSKTDFFANISHEFRTPITVALAAAGALADAGLSPEQSQHVQAVHRAMGRLDRLVDTLLDFARAESGNLSPVLEPVDVAELTSDVLSMFRSGIEAAGLELTVDVEDVGPVTLDREAWIKIVANLVSNAYKFTEQGAIRVTLRRDGNRIILSISDTGAGIDAGEVERVFERFHQVRRSPARGNQGTGIGLALVRDLVEAHHGQVRLDSAPGAGTAVCVALPADLPAESGAKLLVPDDVQTVAARLLESAAPASPVPETAAPAEDTGPLLLLVEDNADLRGYLTRMLSSDGWTVVATPDVPSALRLDRVPNLILTDVMLPGQSGLDLVRLVRAEDRWAAVPVVLLTARSGAHEVTEGLSAGADDYVSKPFEPIELLSRIRTHYELTRERNRLRMRAEERATHLETALGTNREIGVAVGVLMTRERITSERAFEMLRIHSNRTNRKLAHIAAHVALTGQLSEAPQKR